MAWASAMKTLLCGALAAAGIGALLQPAEAAPVRVRFTPNYGVPFPELEWYGEAVIDDGSCTSTGTVSNLFGGCAGQFSITSATVYFADKDAPTAALGQIDFTGGQVIAVDRDSPAPPDWREIISTPFNPAQVTALVAPDPSLPWLYHSAEPYFSLVFIGGYAQLYWFQKDPGDPLLDPLNFPYVNFASTPYYLLCYQEGDNRVGGFLGIDRNRCGISDNVGGDSGALQFAAAEVPEPGTLALVLTAGLGAAGLGLRRRRRG